MSDVALLNLETGQRGTTSAVRISASARYALLATVDLARHGDRTSACEIASRHQIPHPFLEQILDQLRRGGVVHGSGGSGYELSSPADEVSLATVLQAVSSTDGSDRRQVDPGSLGCGSDDTAFQSLWTALEVHIHEFLDGVTVADLAADQLPGWAAQLNRIGRSRP